MTRPNLRTKNVYSALNPAERARLVLDALKREEEADVVIRRTIPPEQAAEFSGLVSLLAVTATELGAQIQAQDALLGQLELAVSFIGDLEMTGQLVNRALEVLTMGIPELLTPSETAHRISEASAERIPLAEAVELASELSGRLTAALRLELKPLVTGGTVSYKDVCSVAGVQSSPMPVWGASTLPVSAATDVTMPNRARDELRELLTMIAGGSDGTRTDRLRTQAKEALKARRTDHAIILGAATNIAEEFAGELPLFQDDEDLLLSLGSRLQRLFEILGPSEDSDAAVGVARLTDALLARARMA